MENRHSKDPGIELKERYMSDSSTVRTQAPDGRTLLMSSFGVLAQIVGNKTANSGQR